MTQMVHQMINHFGSKEFQVQLIWIGSFSSAADSHQHTSSWNDNVVCSASTALQSFMPCSMMVPLTTLLLPRGWIYCSFKTTFVDVKSIEISPRFVYVKTTTNRKCSFGIGATENMTSLHPFPSEVHDCIRLINTSSSIIVFVFASFSWVL